LVVELDGNQHGAAHNRDYDLRRTNYMIERGYRVLRFANHELMDDYDAVLQSIIRAVGSRT
jgi:very-short-patch-repair endonuclease